MEFVFFCRLCVFFFGTSCVWKKKTENAVHVTYVKEAKSTGFPLFFATYIKEKVHVTYRPESAKKVHVIYALFLPSLHPKRIAHNLHQKAKINATNISLFRGLWGHFEFPPTVEMPRRHKFHSHLDLFSCFGVPKVDLGPKGSKGYTTISEFVPIWEPKMAQVMLSFCRRQRLCSLWEPP